MDDSYIQRLKKAFKNRKYYINLSHFLIYNLLLDILSRRITVKSFHNYQKNIQL